MNIETTTAMTSIDPPSNPTLADVARRAGVSAMTVSRVVNGRGGVGTSTRERVERVIGELNYRPNRLARGLKASRSNTIGLMVPDITNPYFPEIVRGAEDVALEAGYTVLLINVIEDPVREAASLRGFEERRADGVLVCSPRLPDARLHALLLRQRAVVVLNRRAPTHIAGLVRVDNESGVRDAVEHLFGLGRKELAVLAGPANSQAGRERLRGIRTTFKDHGLELPPARVARCSPDVAGGAAGARELLARAGTIDGLVCYNDLVAAGALQACAELGVGVPDDLAVVGFDDIAFARMFNPPLTTLHVPKYDLGAAAMRLLLARIHGRQGPAEVTLRPTLVVRGSTRAPADRSVAQEVRP